MLPANLYEARKLLLRNWPFYGMAVMGAGDPVFTLSMPTASTDGIKIFLNPTFIHRMPVPHLAAVLAHEGNHILRADPDLIADLIARKAWPDGTPIPTSDIPRLNQAMDFWINQWMIEEGFQFPKIGICHNPNYKGMSVRQIFDSLPPPPPGDSGNGGTGGNKEGGDGDPVAGKGGLAGGDDIAPKKLTPEETSEHRIKVRQAYEAAKAQGKLPGWADQFVEKLSRPKITFRDFFEPWLHDALDKDDASYRRLNRHYLPDFYAPTIVGVSFGTFVVGMDTSGSCWNEAPKFLSLFNTALQQLRPVGTTLLQFDAAIQGDPMDFPPGQTVECPAKFKVRGGGGTSFVPVFDWIRKHKADQIDGLIMLTDLWGTFPPHRPPYPVLWVSISSDKAPFGTTFNFHQGQDDIV